MRLHVLIAFAAIAVGACGDVGELRDGGSGKTDVRSATFVATAGIVEARALALHASFSESGASFAPARADRPVRFALAGVGRPDRMQPVAEARPSLESDRVVFRREGLVEWFTEHGRGLEHGFTIERSPRGDRGSVRLSIAVEGGVPELEGESVVIAAWDGGRRLSYGALHVFDATGRELESRLRADQGAIAIEYDDTDALYPVTVDPYVVTETVIVPAGAAMFDRVGESVAVDGTTLVVGVPNAARGAASPGAAVVFEKSAGVWTELVRLQPATLASGDEFGNSVAIDGDRIAVGAPRVDCAAGRDCGVVYLFARSAGSWSLQQRIPSATVRMFGWSVAIDGSTLVVGAPNSRDVPGRLGEAFAYREAAGVWALESALVPTTEAIDLGTQVDLSGNRAVVSAPQTRCLPSGAQCGSALVFARSGTSWSHEHTIVGTPARGLFWAVAIEGDTMATGPAHEEIDVYRLGPSGWALEQTVEDGPGTRPEDRFGFAIDLGPDILAVGADVARCGSLLHCGRVHYFERSGSSWTEVTRAEPASPLTDGRLGYSVAVAPNTVIAGRPGPVFSSSGALHVFDIAFVPTCTSAAECTTGFCVDGLCCTSACGGSDPADCRACSLAAGGQRDGECTPLRTDLAPTQLCRASASDCDADDFCSSSSTVCPTDLPRSNGTLCRSASGSCDVPEACDGAAFVCPPNRFAATGTLCRPGSGACDAAERCTGTSTTCPPDTFAAAGTTCRAASGACDVAESCSGTSAACPTDRFAAATVVCRGASGACDVAERCTGTSRLCPSNAFRPATFECRAAADRCDVAERCSGTRGDCPGDSFVPAGTECRAAVGTCDLAERCSGSAAPCPADRLTPPGVACRAAAGICDIAEACTGSAPACPADARVTGGTLCRPVAGGCDVAESCDGSAVDCPVDRVAAASTECRSVAGPCDAAESCDGASRACPVDRFLGTTVSCRAPSGACDAEEWCTAASASCPADDHVADGVSCDADGSVCDGIDECVAGRCTSAPAIDCDDRNACTADSCAEPDGCRNDAIAGCCRFDFDCTDADPCTRDRCVASACMRELDPRCADGDLPDAGRVDAGSFDASVADAMAAPDTGAPFDSGEAAVSLDAATDARADAATAPVEDPGCGCSAGTRFGLGPWLALALLVAIRRTARVRRRDRAGSDV